MTTCRSRAVQHDASRPAIPHLSGVPMMAGCTLQHQTVTIQILDEQNVLLVSHCVVLILKSQFIRDGTLKDVRGCARNRIQVRVYSARLKSTKVKIKVYSAPKRLKLCCRKCS
jgi:hypothetical protein